MSSGAFASTLYWDGDGTGAVGNPPTAGVGGSGTWDAATTPNWWNGTSYQLWTGPGGQDIADFRGTAGTVTINSGETENANQLIFNTDGYIVAGDSSTTLNLTGSSTITTNVGTATISAPIAGGALNVAGPGILAVTGSYSSFAGALTVASGSTLSTNNLLGASQTLNSGTVLYNVASGSSTGIGSPPLLVTGNSTIQFNQPGSGGAASYFYGGLTLSGNLNLDAQTNAVNFYYGMPVINFFGGITLTGNETLSVSGINAGAPTQITTVTIPAGTGGLTGAGYTLTKVGNGNLNVPAGSNYSGLIVTGGSVNSADPSGIPTSSLNVSGGSFGLRAPAGTTINASGTVVSASGTSGITIDQPGSNGGANYTFGNLNLGTGTFAVTEPNGGNYYYNQATITFGATALNGNATMNISGGTAGYTPHGTDRLRATLGPITGPNVLTVIGNGYLTIAKPAAGQSNGSYAGLALAGGNTTVNDDSGIPTASLNLAGGALTLYAAAGSVGNDSNTAVTVATTSTINIDQPQNGGAATYRLGTLSIGASTLTVTQPFTYHYYYGQPVINFGALTLTGNASIIENSGTAGGLLATALGPITGPYTLSYSGNANLNILAPAVNQSAGSYSGLNVSSGVNNSGGSVTINDAGGFPSAYLGLGGADIGATLNLLLPNGKSAAVAATNISGNTLININQAGSTGAASYNLGAVSIGADTLSIVLPAQGNYYYGLPTVTMGATTLTGNVNYNTSGSAGGFTLTPTIGAITGGAFSLTKSGPANLTLVAANNYSGGTTVTGGLLTFAAPGALPMYSALNISTGAQATAANHGGNPKNNLFASSLTLAGSTGAWTSKLDLNNNDLDVQNGNLATLTDQVKQGFNAAAGGYWNGSGGIVSTAAATDSTHLTALGVIQNSVNGSPTGAALYSSAAGSKGLFDGVSPASTDVLLKYTYYGDANLDGKVDGSDYSRIDAAFVGNGTTPGAYSGWYNGDFNYDGVIDGSDYTLIDNAFNVQGAQIASLIAGHGASATAQIAGGAGSSAVPEPASLGILALGSVSLLGRRCRRSR